MLQLFTKPNYLTFILALCFFSFNTLADAPANDLCEGAIELTCGTMLTNVDATTATNSDYPAECLALPSAGVWYTFEGTGDLIDIVVSNMTKTLEIHFFSGTCGDLTCISFHSNPLKVDDYQTTDGTIYYFTVQTFFASSIDVGTFDLSLTCTPPPSAPENDLCGGAVEISCGDALTDIDGSEATNDDNQTVSPPCGATGAGMWYTFETSGNLIDIVLANQTKSIGVSLFEGTCGDLTCVAAESSDSVIDFQTKPETTYYAYITSPFTSTTEDIGTFDLSLVCHVAPENDLCVDAIELTCGDTLTDVDGDKATNVGAQTQCHASFSTGVWYAYEGNGDLMTVTLTPASGVDFRLGIFTGSCGDLNCLVDYRQGAAGAVESFPNLMTYEGTTYYIYVGHASNLPTPIGIFDISVTCETPDPITNDDACDATDLPINVATPFDYDGASVQEGEPSPKVGSLGCSGPDGWCNFDSNVSHSVWFKFIAPDYCIDITTSGTAGDTQIALWEVETCEDFTTYEEVAAHDHIGGNPYSRFSKIENPDLVAGETYYLQIDEFDQTQLGHTAFESDCIDCMVIIEKTCGCTNPDAHNYDENVTEDNGSCETCVDGILNGDEEEIDCGGALCGPCIENDDVCDATSMELNTLMPFDFDGATVEDGEPSPGAGTSNGCQSDDGWCGLETTLNNTVWFSFVAPESCIRITTSGTAGDSQIALWAVDDCGDFTTFELEGANDDINSNIYFSSLIQTDLVPGTTYYLQIDEFDEDHDGATGENDCIDCMVIVEEITCGCTDTEAHNYDKDAVADAGSCETCDDGIQNGDELDIDCGGELCEPCPCYLEGTWEVATYESGCAAGPANRVVVVTFEGGYAPVSYTSNTQGASFISPKGADIYQVIGYGPWSIEATDANGCVFTVESSEMPYVSGTSMTQETGVAKEDGSATVEVTGGTPPYTVEWSNDDEGTIDASGGSHTIEDLASGNYEALVTDDDGNTAKACIYVSRKTSGGGRSGRGSRGKTVDATTTSNGLIAQPNPFAYSTNIRFNLTEDAFTTLSVYSVNGKLMETLYQGQTEAGQDYQIGLNATSWTSGIYILHLTTDKGHVEHQRLLITK